MATSSILDKKSKVFKDIIFLDNEQEAQIEGTDSSNPEAQIEESGSSIPEGEFCYNRNRMIDEFATYLNLVNLPLNLCESDGYERFVQMTLQPAFKKVPLKELLVKVVVAYWNDKRVLRNYFVNFNGHVAVTAELWTSECDERFVCVTCHWIDDYWVKQNRVIGFRIVSDGATNVDICCEIINVLDEFKLRSKVFGVSLGSCLENEECVGYLTNELKPTMRGLFVYDRGCAYFSNLCAQQGMEQLELLINPIRELIRWSRRSFRDDKHVFKCMCKEVGLKPRYFPLDCATSWSSTYEMLTLVFPYREIVTKLYEDNVGGLDFQWDSINSIIQLFGKFKDAIQTFSLVNESNCHLVIQECIHIVHALKSYEGDPLLCLVGRNMKNKWLEHLSDVPVIYCIASILDPRVKLKGLSRLLEYYYKTSEITCCIEQKSTRCRDILSQLYTLYASQMVTLKKDQEIGHSSFGSELIMQILKNERIGGQGNHTTELDEYMMIEHVIPKDFDILQWWKTKEEVFPILSKVAKDVLCTPVSIVALESPFSTGDGEKVLVEQWSTLQPCEIQACVCKRDWDRAEKRAQCLHLQQDDDDDLWMVMDTSDSETD